jgi:hypothetical protein
MSDRILQFSDVDEAMAASLADLRARLASEPAKVAADWRLAMPDILPVQTVSR